jgi:hypothetical protein
VERDDIRTRKLKSGAAASCTPWSFARTHCQSDFGLGKRTSRIAESVLTAIREAPILPAR